MDGKYFTQTHIQAQHKLQEKLQLVKNIYIEKL